MTSMRISTSLMFQRGVNAIESQQVKLSKTEQQLATGERLGSPADDPFASTRIIALEEEKTLLDQYNRNSDYAMARLNQEETALTSAINALQRLRELAVQTANGIYSAEDRRAISEEAYQIRDGLLQSANTTNEDGEYIFSGNRMNTPAYDNTFNYQGDQGQRYIQIGKSRQVETADSGYVVFENIPGAVGGNVMQIADSYAVELDVNGAQDPNAINDIDAAINHLAVIRSRIGGRVNAIESEQGANNSFSESIQKNKSTLKDLDYADAISRFNQELAGLQAAQQSFIKIQNLSLFNYI